MQLFGPLIDPPLRTTFFLVAVGLMILEYLLGRLAHDEGETHDLRESAASLGVALGQSMVRSLEAGLLAILFALADQHRLFDFAQGGAAATAALFLATEFLYYWQHRAAHRIRWMWATHAVHHSPTRMNLTAAVRLGWTGTISGNFLFSCRSRGWASTRWRLSGCSAPTSSTSSSSIPSSHRGSGRSNGC